MPRLRVIPIFALVGVGTAMLLAGCGGGAATPGIASVAGSTTPASTTTQGGPSLKTFSGASGPNAHFQIAMRVGTVDGEKFSECMRKNGITNFPDPDGHGVITISSGTGIDPNSPKFQSARTTCMKLLPNGGQPTPAQIAQQQKELLAYSVCMRAHGIKDFPDPSNGGLQVRVQPGSDLDPNNPQFQSAQKTCQKNLPFKGAGLKG